MLGPEGAGDRVTAWLTARLPARLRLLEARLGLDANSLPNPALVVGHDTGPLGLEDWPAVIVLPGRLEGLELADNTPDGAELYRARYAIEVLGWVRAEDYKATDDLRKRYVLAIREALLERKQLADRPAYGDPAPAGNVFAVDPSSIREDYGPVVTDEARRTIAGVRLDVAVIVAEELAAVAPLGTVATAPEVTATPQPIDEAVEAVIVHPGLM